MRLDRRQLLTGSLAVGAAALLPGRAAWAKPDKPKAKLTALPDRLIHPFAPAQPTASGRKINTLHAHRGRLFTGYGDANNHAGSDGKKGNTGPIHIASYDPASDTWQDHLTFGTEKVSRYRSVGGTLATTASDPRAAHEFVAREGADRLWASVNLDVRQLHVYDLCEGSSPGELWSCGSASGPSYQRAQVWRSTDAGASWHQAFDPGPVVFAAGAQAIVGRFFHIAHLDGTTITQLYHDRYSWMHTGGDESSWLPGPNLNCFQYPVHFDGRLVYGDLDPDTNDNLLLDSVPSTGVLRTLDSQGRIDTIARDVQCGRASELYIEENGHCVGDDGRLYVLGNDRTLLATTSLGEPFRSVGRAPDDVALYSLAVLGGSAYFGSSDGQIFRVGL